MPSSGHNATILFVHPSDEAYGADRVLLTAVEALLERRWSVRVLLPDDVPPGWLSEQLAMLGIDVRRGPLAPARRRYFTPLGLPRYVAELRRARRFVRQAAHDWKPVLIHVNTTALLVGAILGRPNRARLVWHVHEIVVRPRLLGLLFRLVPAATADAVIAISDAVRRWLVVPPHRRANVVRIYNGIEPGPPPDRRRTDAPAVAFIGRLNRWKGAELFIDAAAVLTLRHPGASFRVVGDPPPGEEWRRVALQAQIWQRGLRRSTWLDGHCSDVSDLLASVDIVAVPSLWPEPFGLVTAEAMRAGCAIVASDHGAAPELLDGGRCGLLVRPNDLEALVAGLDRLLTDADLRARLGSDARHRVVTVFGRDQFAERLLGLYAKLLAS